MSKEQSHTDALRAVAALALALLVLLAAGCARPPMSAAHLKRDAWSLEEPRSLTTNFMRFDYQVLPVGDVAGIKGWAYLDMSRLPQWATWADSLSFTAYICDEDGRVLAQDTRTFLPREARADQGIGFEFSLRPKSWGQRPLFIAFGYRMVLTEGRGAKGGNGPFFVSEEATAR